MAGYAWDKIQNIESKQYICGHCGHKVAQDRGFYGQARTGHKCFIYPCPSCTKPTFFASNGKQTPAVRMGREVNGIDSEAVSELYREARDSTSVSAFTGTILICRKILMNIAVQHGAEPGKRFVSYIDYLEGQGFVPPNGKQWVDEIRKKGNEATHEVPAPSQVDAEQILNFVEMLLRFTYEFPSMVQSSNP